MTLEVVRTSSSGREDGDVVQVRWPVGEALRRELADRGVPRLLLVDGDGPAPVCADPLEDWIRLPARGDDVDARMESLLRRATDAPGGAPAIDPDGVVRFGRRWAALPPVEARLMAALVERFGAVVHRDALAATGWPEGSPGRNALDVHMLRLRRRIAPVGLAVRTIRARGYLLEASDSGGVGLGGNETTGSKHARHTTDCDT